MKINYKNWIAAGLLLTSISCAPTGVFKEALDACYGPGQKQKKEFTSENIKKRDTTLVQMLSPLSLPAQNNEKTKNEDLKVNENIKADDKKDFIFSNIALKLYTPSYPDILKTNISNIFPKATFRIDDNEFYLMKMTREYGVEGHIERYAHKDSSVFIDNDYYKKLRADNAFKELDRNNIKTPGDVILVDKTFQKLMIIKLSEQSYIYPINSLDSLVNEHNSNQSIRVAKNMSGYIVRNVVEPEVVMEYDCSTAKIPGTKERPGDGMTPEGFFTVTNVENSKDWTFEGKYAYGPKFFRIQNAIGIHGNGTDTLYHKEYSKNNNHKSTRDRNKKYMAPESLGINSYNFGRGLSHGCIRLNNNVLQELYEKKVLGLGSKILIFEDKELTNLMTRYYNTNGSEWCTQCY